MNLKRHFLFDMISLMRKVKLIAVALVAIACAAPVYSTDNTTQLSWNSAVDILLKNNPQSQSAKYTLDVNRSQLRYSKGSLFPQVSASGSYDILGRSIYDQSYSYSLSASQPLFSPTLTSQKRKSFASVKKSEADYNIVKNNLIYGLAYAFAQLSYTQEALKLSEKTLERRKKNVDIINLKYKAGRESKAALLETRATLKNDLWTHENYRKDLLIAKRNLNKILGRSARTKIIISQLPQAPNPPKDFEHFSNQIISNPAFASKKSELTIAKETIRQAKSSYLPTASARGNYTWSGYNWPTSIPGWSAGVGISWPLFTSGKNTSSVKSAKASQKRVLAELKNLEDDIYLKAEETFLSWRLAYSYMEVAESSLEAVNSRAWLVNKQYLRGQVSYFEWTSAEDRLINTQKQLLTAKKNISISYAAFLNSLGMSLCDKIN
jgi:outer membrane protein